MHIQHTNLELEHLLQLFTEKKNLFRSNDKLFQYKKPQPR